MGGVIHIRFVLVFTLVLALSSTSHATTPLGAVRACVATVLAIFRRPTRAPAPEVERIEPPKTEAARPEPARVEPPVSDFWRSETPTTVEGPNGERLPITMSHDSEITHADALRLLLTSPREFAQVQSELNGASMFMTVEQIAAALRITPEQVRERAVRQGVSRSAASYHIMDLEPNYFAVLYARGNSALFPVLGEAVVRILRARGHAVRWLPEMGITEVGHESSESIPSTFRNDIVPMHALVGRPASHLHVGLPSQAITRPQVVTIARALETLMILNLARHARTHRGRFHTFDSESALRDGEGTAGARGVVRIEFDQFSHPVPAHDLEIRQYIGLENGLSLVELASALASRHRSLVTLPDFRQTTIPDPVSHNLNGALRYAGQLLIRTGRPNNVTAGNRLVAFATQLEVEGSISQARRLEIADFLNSSRILDRLDISVLTQAR